MTTTLEEIYRNNANYVYRYLLIVTRNNDIAEELTQETFYQAIKSLPTFKGECKIEVWLCQIAKYQWYRYLKRKKIKEVSLDEAEEIQDVKTVERDIVEKENSMELYKCIQKLSPTVRDVLYLRLRGEFSFADIGEILGKSENWARVTFYRGKKKLKEDMGSDGEN